MLKCSQPFLRSTYLFTHFLLLSFPNEDACSPATAKMLSEIQQMYGKVPPQIHLPSTKGRSCPHWTKAFPSHKRKRRTWQLCSCGFVDVPVVNMGVSSNWEPQKNDGLLLHHIINIKDYNRMIWGTPNLFRNTPQRMAICSLRLESRTPTMIKHILTVIDHRQLLSPTLVTHEPGNSNGWCLIFHHWVDNHVLNHRYWLEQSSWLGSISSWLVCLMPTVRCNR